MIINHAPKSKALLSADVSAPTAFGIKSSSKAFGILSSGLYSNKIRAIIRELGCNAVDSHKAANNPDPIEVHLPTVLEPYFYVKDYGVGLSDNEVTSIYTTYFESTKTDSNDFIGALGLGSKSPFSYVNNFSITAIKDGVCNVYTAFINDEGVPSVAKMATFDTNDSNGVEVRFAVDNSKDFRRFVEESQFAFKWFEVYPNVINGVDGPPDRPAEFLVEDIGAGVGILKNTNDRYFSRRDDNSSRSIAIMGNISYPVEIPAAESVLGENLSWYLDFPLVFRFDIGEIEFQASRESLAYDERTVEAFRKKLTILHDNCDTFFKKRYLTGTYNWKSAEKIANECSRSYNFLRRNAIEFATSTPGSMLTKSLELVSLRASEKYVIDNFNISIRAFSTKRRYDRARDTYFAISEITPKDRRSIVSDHWMYRDDVVPNQHSGSMTTPTHVVKTIKELHSKIHVINSNSWDSSNTTKFGLSHHEIDSFLAAKTILPKQSVPVMSIRPSLDRGPGLLSDSGLVSEKTLTFRVGRRSHYFINNNVETKQLNRYIRAHVDMLRASKDAEFDIDNTVVYWLSPTDPTQPMETDKFYKAIQYPTNIVNASDIKLPEVTPRTLEPGRLLSLATRRSLNTYEYVWEDAGLFNPDDQTPHFYVRLAGYERLFNPPAIPKHNSGLAFQNKKVYSMLTSQELLKALNNSGISEFESIRVFGVRKNLYDQIKGNANWICLDDYVREVIEKKLDKDSISVCLMINNPGTYQIEAEISSLRLIQHVVHILRKQDPNIENDMTTFSDQYKLPTKSITSVSVQALGMVIREYLSTDGLGNSSRTKELNDQILNRLEVIHKKYPMAFIVRTKDQLTEIANYVNLIDSIEGKKIA